ncbi:MAG: ExbD/TolR family protein [Candidatus Anammoxibacter sp.]
MKLKTGFENKKARIEMLPLIDVVFLLLVFFIYAMLSMTVQRGLKVSLPKAESGITNHDEYISITINSENEIFLNKEKVNIPDLPDMIKNMRSNKQDLQIYINGDEKAELGIAIEILDVLRVHGIEEVNFVTKKRSGSS